MKYQPESGAGPGGVAPPVRPNGPSSTAARLPQLVSDSRARYEKRRMLGAGGMGTVYEVWDRYLRRLAAMKVLHGPDGCDARVDVGDVSDRLLDRFLEEAQVTGQLEHPGIVPVHEVGIDDERHPFFTMQLVRGEPLDALIAKVHAGSRRWTQERLVEVLLRVCDVLAYAHAKGVVHRDLKPSNIMAGRFGEIYVMDWGLAKVLVERCVCESASGLLTTDRAVHGGPLSDTALGQIVGTPSFMSPEQAQGKSQLLGPASDVYALGSILYNLLAGVAPYADGSAGGLSSHALLSRVIASTPTPIEVLAPRAPEELLVVCRTAMQRDIEARYAGPRELAEALRVALRAGATPQRGPWAALRRIVTGRPRADS